jgi:DNA-binding response OmpR family regulator
VGLDLVLPRLSGRDVCREMKARADTRDIPIIVVSGHDVNDLKESDFACVLRKPLDPDTLVVAVKKCMSGGSGPPPTGTRIAANVPRACLV